MKECTDEIMLQAYFDGELSAAQMQRMAAHLASCAKCAEAAREIENEMEALALAFAPEMALPVPTESLRARLDFALAEIDAPVGVAARPSWRERFAVWLGALNLSPQMAVACAAVVVSLAGVAFYALANRQEAGLGAQSLARVNWPDAAINPTPAPTPTLTEVVAPKVSLPQARLSLVKYVRPETPAANNRKANLKPEKVTEPQLLAGEANYLKTIASLERAVAAQQAEFEVQPRLRAVYERNVALLDQAINASRRSARRNPKDTDAAEFLYTSYQSKVDLMNTFATSVRPTIAER